MSHVVHSAYISDFGHSSFKVQGCLKNLCQRGCRLDPLGLVDPT
jgi:hypothetical protein